MPAVGFRERAVPAMHELVCDATLAARSELLGGLSRTANVDGRKKEKGGGDHDAVAVRDAVRFELKEQLGVAVEAAVQQAVLAVLAHQRKAPPTPPQQRLPPPLLLRLPLVPLLLRLPLLLLLRALLRHPVIADIRVDHDVLMLNPRSTVLLHELLLSVLTSPVDLAA